MHILQNYALSCGLKLSEPFIYDKIFPIPYEKYIVISIQNSISNYKYNLWMDVIFTIKDILKKSNINIVVLSVDDNRVEGANTVNINKISSSQLAYIIKNSLLHCGVDDFIIALASYFKVKNIGIYNDEQNFKNHGPLNPEVKTLIDSQKEKLNPEVIANEIFALLNINSETGLLQKTAYIGDHYSNNAIFEIIPSQPVPNNIPQNAPINIRFDYIKEIGKNELENTFNTLKSRACVFFTDKVFNISVFSPLKQNIHSVVYDVTKEVNISFITEILKITPNLKIIFYLNESNENHLNDRKLELVDFPFVINEITKPKVEIKKDQIKNCRYRSSRLLFGNNQLFLSKAAWLEKKPLMDLSGIIEQNTNDIKNLEMFFDEDINFSFIYKID